MLRGAGAADPEMAEAAAQGPTTGEEAAGEVGAGDDEFDDVQIDEHHDAT